jgi:hypothetical protein
MALKVLKIERSRGIVVNVSDILKVRNIGCKQSETLATFSLPNRRLFFCKGNLTISMNIVMLAGENQSQLCVKLSKTYTHLARENQGEKSKVFPAEGETMYRNRVTK